MHVILRLQISYNKSILQLSHFQSIQYPNSFNNLLSYLSFDRSVATKASASFHLFNMDINIERTTKRGEGERRPSDNDEDFFPCFSGGSAPHWVFQPKFMMTNHNDFWKLDESNYKYAVMKFSQAKH